MERQQAREDLVQAGKELVKAGCIARAWGNLSARIDETDFVITPSGRARPGLRYLDPGRDRCWQPHRR